MRKTCENCFYSDGITETCKFWDDKCPEKKECPQFVSFAKDDMKPEKIISMDTLNFEKFFSAMQALTKPLKLGQKKRVIVDYDPQEPKMIFRYFNLSTDEPEKQEDQ